MGGHGVEPEAHRSHDLIEETVGPPVEIVTEQHVIPLDEGLGHRGERGHPAGEGDPVLSPFQHGHVLLQRGPGAVVGARVLVTPVVPHSLLDIGGGLVDRCHDGAGGRIGLLSGVNAAGGKMLVGHGNSSLGRQYQDATA